MGFRKGTGFTNLNKVMTANRGNKLGSAVAGGISTQNQGVNTGIQTSQQKFQEEAQKNRLDTDEAKDKREEILGRFNQPGQLVSASGTSNVPGSAQAPAGGSNQSAPGSMQPNQPAQSTYQSPVSEQEISDFSKFRTGTYAGPKELRDSGALYSKAQQAEQSGQLAKSGGGRQELLRRFVGQGDYNQGQRQLDETLLGQDADALRTAARQTRGATGRVDEANQQAGGLAQEYAGRAKIFGDETGKRIGEVRTPFSTGLDTRVTEMQGKETGRLANLKSIQDALSGTGENYKGLDKNTQLGLGLQEAMDRGHLSQADADRLLGGGGLIARGQEMGLDLNSLINERIQSKAAQNVGRTGVASDEEIAKLNALDRLSGKQGTDLEFLQGQGDYAGGSTGFDLGSLEDYISRTEKEKGAADQATADKIAERKARYMNQAIAGGQQSLEGTAQLGGAALGAYLNPESYYNPGVMGQNINQGIQGGANAAIGGAQAYSQSQNAILEGLTKLNIGGKSIADTEGGRQLLKAIELKSQMENAAGATAGQYAQNIGGGVQDLASGNIGGALTNFYKAPTNVVKNVGGAVGGAVKKITGGGIKISDEDLKTDIDYSPKDVQGFMDRLKPASYDYKDEVKNDPRASKDRQIGVMAQDLEKSKLGKESVHNEDVGKVVDYKDLEPKMLASLAALNQRLKKIEGKE